MYKKLLLALFMSSPLLAMEDTYIPSGEEIANRRSEREGESRFGEDLECCLCFLPRVGLMCSFSVVVAGALTFEVARGAGRLVVGVARGAVKRVKQKTD